MPEIGFRAEYSAQCRHYHFNIDHLELALEPTRFDELISSLRAAIRSAGPGELVRLAGTGWSTGLSLTQAARVLEHLELVRQSRG
jgi:hypothetical protein